MTEEDVQRSSPDHTTSEAMLTTLRALLAQVCPLCMHPHTHTRYQIRIDPLHSIPIASSKLPVAVLPTQKLALPSSAYKHP